VNNNPLQVSEIIYIMIQHAQSNRGAPHSKLGSPNCKYHTLWIGHFWNEREREREREYRELLTSSLVYQICESAAYSILY